jgi:hypothetical protein
MKEKAKVVQVYMTNEMWEKLEKKRTDAIYKPSLSKYIVEVLEEDINKEILKKVY